MRETERARGIALISEYHRQIPESVPAVPVVSLCAVVTGSFLIGQISPDVVYAHPLPPRRSSPAGLSAHRRHGISVSLKYLAAAKSNFRSSKEKDSGTRYARGAVLDAFRRRLLVWRKTQRTRNAPTSSWNNSPDCRSFVIKTISVGTYLVNRIKKLFSCRYLSIFSLHIIVLIDLEKNIDFLKSIQFC